MGNSFLYKLEKKFGRYAIPNLPLMMILCYGVGYLIQMINPQFLAYLTLEPSMVLKGQIWRILTWVIIPPSSSNFFFVLIMLFFYYSIGTSLERTWGMFYYNVYIFSGLLFSVAAAFGMYGIGYALLGNVMNSFPIGALVSTYYINMSIFLAYAATFPNAQVLLMFIIPVRMKWMGIVYGVLLLYEVIFPGFGFAVFDWAKRVMIIASLLNFLIFFLTNRTTLTLDRNIRATRNNFKRNASMMQSRERAVRSGDITRHKCAVCGQTEVTSPNLSFRFCSKCNGNYEYCENHLFTHTHIK